MALSVYEATASFPSSERFGLVSQMRRGVVSIASNLAEGSGRNSERELMRFALIAAGSATEVECQVEISRDLGLLAPDRSRSSSILMSVHEVRRMIRGLINASRRSPGNPHS